MLSQPSASHHIAGGSCDFFIEDGCFVKLKEYSLVVGGTNRFYKWNRLILKESLSSKELEFYSSLEAIAPGSASSTLRFNEIGSRFNIPEIKDFFHSIRPYVVHFLGDVILYPLTVSEKSFSVTKENQIQLTLGLDVYSPSVNTDLVNIWVPPFPHFFDHVSSTPLPPILSDLFDENQSSLGYSEVGSYQEYTKSHHFSLALSTSSSKPSDEMLEEIFAPVLSQSCYIINNLKNTPASSMDSENDLKPLEFAESDVLENSLSFKKETTWWFACQRSSFVINKIPPENNPNISEDSTCNHNQAAESVPTNQKSEDQFSFSNKAHLSCMRAQCDCRKGNSSIISGIHTVLIQDICHCFKKPCILDIKMGVRQYGLHTSVEKRQRKEQRAFISTSHQFGVRLHGFRYWCPKSNGFKKCTKHECLTFSIADVKQHLYTFLMNGDMQLVQIAKFFFNDLFNIFNEQRGLYFFTSSLLLVFDHDYPLETIKLRMVDFAHTHTTFEMNGTEATTAFTGVDEGYIKGLKTILILLDEIISEIK